MLVEQEEVWKRALLGRTVIEEHTLKIRFFEG